MNQQLLNMVESALIFSRYLICLLILVSAIKTLFVAWLNFKISALAHKSTYEFIVDNSHSIRIMTHEKIDIKQVEALTQHSAREVASIPERVEINNRAS